MHMRNVNAEIIKNDTTGGMDMKEMVIHVKEMVGQGELRTAEAEEDARSLELELMTAQAQHERREEAESRGRETNEKISELTG